MCLLVTKLYTHPNNNNNNHRRVTWALVTTIKLGQVTDFTTIARRLRLGIVVNNNIIIIITTSLGQTVAGNGCMVGRSVDGGY